MTPGEATFVEEMGHFLGTSGMTPMSGRMWAWLLICDPPEQTASELATELHASRGAISGTARLLESAGMIRRGRRRGDRSEYFSMYGRFRAITEVGLAVLADRPPSVSARLREVHAAFTFFEREYPALIARYLRERAAIETVALTPAPAPQDVPA